MITRSVACTPCPADAHFSGSHHAFYSPWTLFPRRPDYLRAWNGLETVAYSQATQHVAWENSPTFLDATTPSPLPPPPTRNDQWRGTQTCVSRNVGLFSGYAVRDVKENERPFVVQLFIKTIESLQFSCVIGLFMTREKDIAVWSLDLNSYILWPKRTKNTHTPTKLSRWKTTPWIF